MADSTDADRSPEEAPIEELATLLEEAPEGLSGRVRASIQRRLLAADVAELSLSQVVQVFLEFIKVLFESIGVARPERERRE